MVRRWLPLLITALLLLALAAIVDTSQAVTLLARISPLLLALAVVATGINILISCLRYRIILRAMTGANESLNEIFRINLLSVFAAHFLPIAAAADGLRIVLASARFRLEAVRAVESVVADRLLAVTGLCAAAMLALPLQAALGTSLTLLAVQLVATTAVVAISALLLWSASRGGLPRWPWIRHLALLTRGVAGHFARAAELRTQLLLALASALTFAAILWVLAAGMGMHLSALEALAFGPVIYLSQVIPFVYFGFGAREAVTVLFLSGIGSLNAESAFSLGLAVGVCNILVALPAPVVAGHLLRQWRRGSS